MFAVMLQIYSNSPCPGEEWGWWPLWDTCSGSGKFIAGGILAFLVIGVFALVRWALPTESVYDEESEDPEIDWDDLVELGVIGYNTTTLDFMGIEEVSGVMYLVFRGYYSQLAIPVSEEDRRKIQRWVDDKKMQTIAGNVG